MFISTYKNNCNEINEQKKSTKVLLKYKNKSQSAIIKTVKERACETTPEINNQNLLKIKIIPSDKYSKLLKNAQKIDNYNKLKKYKINNHKTYSISNLLNEEEKVTNNINNSLQKQKSVINVSLPQIKSVDSDKLFRDYIRTMKKPVDDRKYIGNNLKLRNSGYGLDQAFENYAKIVLLKKKMALCKC